MSSLQMVGEICLGCGDVRPSLLLLWRNDTCPVHHQVDKVFILQLHDLQAKQHIP